MQTHFEEVKYYRNATWEGKVFVQNVGKCLLPIFPSEWSTAINHFIEQYT